LHVAAPSLFGQRPRRRPAADVDNRARCDKKGRVSNDSFSCHAHTPEDP
jgi:hypothetical protein